MGEEICLALLRTGISGEFLDVREKKERGNGKYCVIRSFIISTLHAVLSE
jgi:hypothetical protein